MGGGGQHQNLKCDYPLKEYEVFWGWQVEEKKIEATKQEISPGKEWPSSAVQ